MMALEEVKPSFGVQYEDLLLRIPHGIILFNNKNEKNIRNSDQPD